VEEETGGGQQDQDSDSSDCDRHHQQPGNGGTDCGGGSRDGAYWRAVGLMLQQWDGLVAGYTARSKAAGGVDSVGRLSREDLLFLHSNGAGVGRWRAVGGWSRLRRCTHRSLLAGVGFNADRHKS